MKVRLPGAGRIGVLHASVLAGDPGVDEIGEAENPCTARDALEALKVAMAADRSLAERSPVAISEVE